MTQQTSPTKTRGRPHGAGPVARLRKELLADGKLDKLLVKTYELAMAGDVAAVRILLDRVIPPLRAQAAPVQFALTGNTLTAQAKALLAAAAAGELPPDVASELISALARVVQIDQGDELRRRLDALDGGDLT